MQRHHVLVAGALAAVVIAAVALAVPPADPADSTDADRTYPPGAGPDHIDFSALETDGTNASHAPRRHWDSFAITYTAPPERRLVEGEYYVESTTGEMLADRWHGATVYRNGTVYAFVQPAEAIPNEHRRAKFDSDPAFVYHDATDAYYRYDPQYGRIARTNIGRHTEILEAYTWEAVGTTTHHGVPVITYRVTGTRTNDPNISPATNGTLRLGVGDGLVYAYDITLDAGENTYRYAYAVRPVPFPEHDWVDTARAVAARNGSAER